MKLLSQIQEEAANSSTNIGDLLRRCRILASKLPHAELEAWVDRELDGYRDVDSSAIPPYRITPSNAHGYFLGRGGSYLRDTPIPSTKLKEGHQHWAETVELREPVAAYADLLMQPAGGIKVEWPANLVAMYQRKFYRGYALHSAWQSVSRNQIVGLVDAVRNKVLMFALDLAEAFPEINESDEPQPLSSAAQAVVSQIFNMTVNGNVGNLATGSGFSQSATVVGMGDLNGLRKALAEIGVPSPDITELEDCIRSEGKPTAGKIGAGAADWIGKMMSKAASGVLEVSLSTAGTLLTKVISAYYGLPQ